jgi:uncharacterized membrane protein YeaQ/YmgE (transglycosylase-associated protein family)
LLHRFFDSEMPVCGWMPDERQETTSVIFEKQMRDAMIWTSTNLVIQIVAGVLGGHFAASAAEEHRFGFLGHTLVGAVGGALSGTFLQKLAVTVVTASGSLNEIDAADNVVLQVLTGLAAGGCLTLIVGFIKHSIEKHKAEKN